MLNSEFALTEEPILKTVGEGFGAKPGISVGEVDSDEENDDEEEIDELDDNEEDDEEEDEEEEISTW